MNSRFQLYSEENILKLKDLQRPKFKPIYVDFLEMERALKRQAGIGKNQLIAKAIGFKKPGLTVLDVTLGLAKDAFMFYFLGCKVIGVEKSEPIFSLVENALERSNLDHKRISFFLNDSKNFLLNLKPDSLPDVIYLDPMYPEKISGAAPKGEMQLMRDLIGTTTDDKEILTLSLARARLRVVIKRPPKAEVLAGPLIHSYKGKAVRYDAYSGLGS